MFQLMVVFRIQSLRVTAEGEIEKEKKKKKEQ